MSSDPTPAPDKPDPASETKTGNSLPKVRRPRKILPTRQEEESPAQPGGLSSDQLLALGAQLQALLSPNAKLPTPETAAGEPAAGEQPAVTAKNRRFTAKGPAPAPEAPPAAPGTTSGSTGTAPAAGSPPPATVTAKKAPVVPAPDKPIEEAFVEQRRQKLQRELQQRRRNIFLAAAALATLAFFGGRLSAPSPVIQVPKEPSTIITGSRAAGLPPWPESAVHRLGEILTMDREGKLEEAYMAATELRTVSGDLPGLELYMGNLLTRRLRFNDAHARLGVLTGVDIPPLLNAVGSDVVGFTYARQRAFQRAIKAFSDAVINDPFEGKYYYHWAEALRRRGQFEEAIGVFQQGLLRVPSTEEGGGLRGAMTFKLQLARLEANQGGPAKEQVATGLQDPGQAGYWQLATAAGDLQENHIPEAVDALQKAKANLSADVYDALASDYFYRTYVTQAGVAAVLPPNDIAHLAARVKRGDYFVDP